MAKQRQRRVTPTRVTVAPEVYPHSPLVEVIFELRFPGEPVIECRRDEYFASIRREFPMVWVPNVEIGQAPALRPYSFKSADETETIMVALNRFAYSTRQYHGIAMFQRRALTLAKGFCKRFAIGALNRVGLRYLNIVRFARDEGRIPWAQHFTVRMNLPGNAFDGLKNIDLAYEATCDAGTATTRIACVRSDAEGEAFLLDLDFAKTGDVTAVALSTAVREAHAHIKRVFEGLVSEQYKAVMRGEVIA